MISITVDTKQVEAALKGLKQSVQDSVLRQALKKAADKGRTELKRQVAKEYAVTQADANAQMKSYVVAGKVQAVIEVFPAKPGRRSRNVIMFLERKVTLAEAKKRAKSGTLNQLRFKFRRARPNVMIPGAFVATANRGTFVARRTGKSRLPIKAVHVIDIPQMAGAKRVLKEALAKIEKQYLPEEVERAIQAALKRFGR